MANAFVVAAPASGSGKTMATLALLRAFRNQGWRVASAKVGPDYIDPRFHEAASARPCMNLDLWAMGAEMCRSILHSLAHDADLVIVEGVMGLFDGPQDAKGSTADLAEILGLPIVLVVDASHQAQSIAALIHGFRTYRNEVDIAGVILNRVASDRHQVLLHEAIEPLGIPVFGALPKQTQLAWPSRHLGLVQAQENQALETFIASAAASAAECVSLSGLAGLGAVSGKYPQAVSLPPPAQRIAVAQDEAFSFMYPHMLAGWRRAGAEIMPFSPLANDAPAADTDIIILPGGYPELHAGRLAANEIFLAGLKSSQAAIYGECGGYMVLGEALIDEHGTLHKMAGLLPLTTSFAHRKLQLGYRALKPLSGPWTKPLRGHEFHYSAIVHEGDADRVFEAADARGQSMGSMGLRRGKVSGSFAHVICEAA